MLEGLELAALLTGEETVFRSAPKSTVAVKAATWQRSETFEQQEISCGFFPNDILPRSPLSIHSA